MNTENRARIRTAIATIEFALDTRTDKPVFISKTPNVFVTREIFDAAREQAAAILRKKAAERKKKKKMEQIGLL